MFSSFYWDRVNFFIRRSPLLNPIENSPSNNNILTEDSKVNNVTKEKLIQQDNITFSNVKETNITADQLISIRQKPITHKEKEKVLNWFKAEDNDLVSLSYGIMMTVETFKRLKDGNWLNDDVINFYMNMLQDRNNEWYGKAKGLVQSVQKDWFLCTYFFQKLLQQNHKDVRIRNKYDFENVKSWTKSDNPFHKSKLFFPINHNNSHWTLLVVFIDKKEIRYYNSLNSGGLAFMKHIFHWLQDVVVHLKLKNIEVNESDWKFIDTDDNQDVPKQTNGFDCGMFVINYADYLTDELPLQFNQNNIQESRLRVGHYVVDGFIQH